jgi:hypothetical protein
MTNLGRQNYARAQLKFQAPRKLQILKLQDTGTPFEYWNLEFTWSLGFGIWNFARSVSPDIHALIDRAHHR